MAAGKGTSDGPSPGSSPPGGWSGSARFRVVRRLGEGGMGVVYEVLDLERQTRVAAKTLRHLDPDALLRFKNEFRALADLHHRNLVSLGELFEEAGQWFFTMELVEGPAFLRWLRPHAASGEAELVSHTITSDKPREETRPVTGPLAHADAVGDEPPTIDDRARAPISGSVVGLSAAARALLGPLDLGRLRDALAQLTRGLQALHAAGKVHRDVKPSNVLVSASDGRVVLADFGLVTEHTRAPVDEDGDHVVGTAAYMAPEQASGAALVGPAADWYAVGALLYRALSGRLPFLGGARDVLARKQREAPPLLPDGVGPPDLCELCLALLAPEPALRPDSARILEILGQRVESVAPALGDAPELVGRQVEVGELERALVSSRDGLRCVLVYGESGVGKSALVRHFLEAAGARDAVVLRGRCYERESVPYKAVDGVIDALVRHLAAHPQPLPDDVRLLARVFPVLGRLDAAAPAEASTMHPQELRRRAFAALRAILLQLGATQPLVVAIDDLQWADADSQALLAEVLRAPDAPRLCLIATMRAGDKSAVALPPGTHTLVLESLPPRDALALTRRLLGSDTDIETSAAEGIAREAGGHPLYIGELVRHRQAHRVVAAGTPRLANLDVVLAERVRKLPGPARRLLELVCVAGVPLAQETVALAAALEPDAAAAAIAALRVAHLVHTSGTRRTDSVEPYHDRVREALTSGLTPSERRAAHARLAQAMEATGAELEALAHSWREAGELARAAEYCAMCAQRAARTFAFDRAARLYRQALELRPPDARSQELLLALGEALANAGRGLEAAQAFSEAAERGATPAEALELNRRAAEQLLRSGHIDEGVDKLDRVLQLAGLRLSRRPWAAFASLLWGRARVRLRGLGFVAKETVPPAVATRIDCTHAAALGLGVVDVVRGADFQTRTLLAALGSGDRVRIARALSMEAAHAATAGKKAQARVGALLAASARLAAEVDTPYVRGVHDATSGLSAFLFGRWRECFERTEAAAATFRAHCQGAQWELASCELFSLWALAYLGEIAQLQARVPSDIADALRRGDVYAATNLRTGSLNFVWLAQDDPGRARDEALEAMRIWSKRGFYHQHWDDLLAQGEIDLYEGRAEEACARVERTWRPLEKSFLLMVTISRVEAVHLRARARLALASGLAADDPRRAASLAQAEKWTRRIAREGEAWATPLAELLLAGIAQQRGQTEQALALLAAADEHFTALEMALYAHAARHVRAPLVAGDEGQALRRSAETWMAKQHIRNPARFVAMLAPGF